MHQFELDVGRAINLARRRNADTEVSLGFINGFTVSIGGATGDTRVPHPRGLPRIGR